MKFIKTWAITMSFLLCLTQAQAVILLISDNDGTITNDDINGNVITYYELFRVHEPSLSYIEMPKTLPNSILISHVDYEAYKHHLSKGEGHTGSLEQVPLFKAETKKGKHLKFFVPGFYKIQPSMTFSRYRGDEYYDPDIENPTNYWLDSYKAGVEMSAKGKGTHKGLGHSLASYYLSSYELASAFRLLTFRGYPTEAALDVFKFMQEIGEINVLPYTNPNHKPLGLWMLGSPDLIKRFGPSFYKKKALFVEELANQYRMSPPLEKVLNPDGTKEDFYHTFIFQDDHPEIIQHYIEMAQDLTRRGQHRIKFVIRHLGNQEAMDANEFTIRDVVITSNGTPRKAGEEEYFIPEEIVKKANKRLIKSCLKTLTNSNFEVQ